MSAPTVVLKFGGTSLATPRRVRLAARRVEAHVRRGRRVAVVVSAAGRTTDRILTRVGEVGRAGTPRETLTEWTRELDRVLTTGEDRSAALLAVALCQRGLPARSLRGGEAGVRARGPFGDGRITRVEAAALRRLLDAGVVPVVSGFQGQRPDGETVTLGRGGSDTSAVALAAALDAPCHIVTDVDAIHDRDPALHTGTQPYATLDHRSLVELVEGGARVVHPAAARLAAERKVPLRVYHFGAASASEGTRVGAQERPLVATAGEVA